MLNPAVKTAVITHLVLHFGRSFTFANLAESVPELDRIQAYAVLDELVGQTIRRELDFVTTLHLTPEQVKSVARQRMETGRVDMAAQHVTGAQVDVADLAARQVHQIHQSGRGVGAGAHLDQRIV